MGGLLFFGVGVILCGLAMARFYFLSVLVYLEVLNVHILLFTYLFSLHGAQIGFLAFMVVATVEVTIALACLTRLWDPESLAY